MAGNCRLMGRVSLNGIDRRALMRLGGALVLSTVAAPSSYAADAYAELSRDPRFRTWKRLVDSADLKEFTRNNNRYTIFAPIDASFDNIDPDLLRAIGPSASSGGGVDDSETRFVVQSHVTMGEVPATALAGKVSTFTSLNGKSITIDATKKPVEVTFAASKGTLVGDPITIDNGLIYPVELTSAHYVPQ